nr:MAG TPA: hypothetical protein [Caudoviricetes sp.]
MKNKNCSFCSESSFYTNNGVSVGTHIVIRTSFITHTEPFIQKDRRLQFLYPNRRYHEKAMPYMR